jgi:hypothetical protein
MTDPALDIGEYLTRIGLIPAPVQLFGRNAELDNEIARKIRGLDLAPLLTSEADQGRLIIAHNDPGVRAADEVTPISGFDPDRPQLHRGLLRRRVWVRDVIWGRNGISLSHGIPPWLGLGSLWCSSTSAARPFLDIKVSMARQSVISRKKRGPPPTGKGVPILVRLQPPLLADVDQWIAKQDVAITRPQAIRRLIESALAAKSKRQSNRGEK